nr:MAG TPA: hypothetical protein [Caudoviricetes sp.]
MIVCVYDFLCIYNRKVPNWVPQKNEPTLAMRVGFITILENHRVSILIDKCLLSIV